MVWLSVHIWLLTGEAFPHHDVFKLSSKSMPGEPKYPVQTPILRYLLSYYSKIQWHAWEHLQCRFLFGMEICGWFTSNCTASEGAGRLQPELKLCQKALWFPHAKGVFLLSMTDISRIQGHGSSSCTIPFQSDGFHFLQLILPEKSLSFDCVECWSETSRQHQGKYMDQPNACFPER